MSSTTRRTPGTRWTRGLALVAAALAVATLAGASEAQAPKAGSPPMIKLDYEKYTLPNGLDVILRRDPSVPIVAVNLWYHVGPANETDGPHRVRAPLRAHDVPGLGARRRRRALRAARGRRRVAHQRHDELRPHQLLRGPAVEPARAGAVARDRPHGLPARHARPGEALEPAGRGAQRAPAERRERAVRPGRGGALAPALPAGHPYYASVIGSHDDIQAAKLEDVRAFFKQYYTPNNATLAIVGDIDVAKTKAAGREVLRPHPARRRRADDHGRRRRRSRPSAAS